MAACCRAMTYGRCPSRWPAYAANDLDQWGHWRVKPRMDLSNIDLSVQRPLDATEDAYTTIWPLLERLRSGH